MKTVMADWIDDESVQFTVTRSGSFSKYGPSFINEVGLLTDTVVFSTSSPLACGVGEIAPSLVEETVLVVILTTALADLHKLLPRAVKRNRPNRVLALVTGWSNDIHEASLRNYINATYSLPLTVEHTDR